MTPYFRLTPYLCAPLALLFGVWAAALVNGHTAVAKGIAVYVNGHPITHGEIEQRARLLALSANVGAQAKDNFRRLVKSKSTDDRFQALQREVIDTNPGKTKTELIAIFQKRQKEVGLALHKQAVEEAREALMPKLRKDAREALIDERLKLQAAKQEGIEVSDDEVKGLVTDLAERNRITYEEFAQRVKDMGVDIATMGEKFRAQKAWRDMAARHAPSDSAPGKQPSTAEPPSDSCRDICK